MSDAENGSWCGRPTLRAGLLASVGRDLAATDGRFKEDSDAGSIAPDAIASARFFSAG
jgi:hypothetical protein